MKKIVVPSNMKLVPVTDADHEWLVELHNDPQVLNNIRDPRPISMEHHMSWWKGIKDNQGERRLIFTVDGERVGFTKFYAIDLYNQHCILGADIHPQFRGRGLAKYMWTLMLEVCFDELGLHRAALSTAGYNAIGKRVYDNLGFLVEGLMKDYQHRNGEYFDAICMYMLRDWWDARTT